jgi:phosphoribosylformylglycinamidine (FGAM) synthase-like amidotransferase family enzyme
MTSFHSSPTHLPSSSPPPPVQALLRQNKIRAGHDISDGGLLVAALEMGFAGDRSLTLHLPSPSDPADAAHGAIAALFAEEVGLLLEVAPTDEEAILAAYRDEGVPCARVGQTADRSASVRVSVHGAVVLEADLGALRDAWEASSFELEKLQANPICVAQEQAGLSSRHAPNWRLSFTPSPTVPPSGIRARVAVLRQEGSNGDREMAAALYAAGLEPWDVAMGDLQRGVATLDGFRGVVFVGGFSYADVLDSAKGWAGVVKFDARLSAQVSECTEDLKIGTLLATTRTHSTALGMRVKGGVVLEGGFSYADVLDSAKGWAGVVKFDARLSAQVSTNTQTQPHTTALGMRVRGGVVLVGGFSYANVLDSAKGWAGVVKFDARLSAQVRMHTHTTHDHTQPPSTCA